jgi:two-component system response regulator GlrR
MSEFYLVIRHNEAFDRLHRVESSETLIGRDPSSGIRLDGELVSRRHAVLLKTESGCVVRDLSSRNGTWLNGSRILADEQLCDRCELRIGDYRLQVCSSLGRTLETIDENDDSTRSGPNGTAGQATGPGFSRLTPAQRRVYDLLLEGFIEKEVAARLKISVHTVHDHVKAIYRTLSVSTRGELISKRTADRVMESDV